MELGILEMMEIDKRNKVPAPDKNNHNLEFVILVEILLSVAFGTNGLNKVPPTPQQYFPSLNCTISHRHKLWDKRLEREQLKN